MKRRLLTCLGLPLVLSCLTGCSSGSKFPDLSGFTLDDAGSYNAIGYGALKKDEARNKKLRRNASSEVTSNPTRARRLVYSYYGTEQSLDVPFSLLGQAKNSGIESLSFSKDGKECEDFYISGYYDYGSLVAFELADPSNVGTYYRDGQPGTIYSIQTNNGLIPLASSIDIAPVYADEPFRFILSKSTGKIYPTFEVDSVYGVWPWLEIDGVVYCSSAAWNSSYTYCSDCKPHGLYKLYEENGTLRLDTVYGPSFSLTAIDCYGNLLSDLGFVTSKGEARFLSSYLSKEAEVLYAPGFERIVARDNGKTYVLNENGDFVEKPIGHALVTEGYDVFDSEEAVELPSFPGVEGSEAKTWQEYLGEGEAEFGPVTIDNPRSWYCFAIPWLMENKESLEDYDELLQSKFASITEEELLKACVSCIEDESLFFDENGYLLAMPIRSDDMNGSPAREFLKYHPFWNLSGPEETLDYLRNFAAERDSIKVDGASYGFGARRSLDLDEEGNPTYVPGVYELSFSDTCYYATKFTPTKNELSPSIIRGNDFYGFSDGRILKISLPSMAETVVDTEGYVITGLDCDDYGDILVTGIDGSLSSFSGYLDANDEITFTKNEDSLKSYTLYPIN